MSRRDSTAVRSSLGVLALVFFVLALERLINASMAGIGLGARTGGMLSAALAFTGFVLLGLLLLSRAARSECVDADIGFSHGRRKA